MLASERDCRSRSRDGINLCDICRSDWKEIGKNFYFIVGKIATLVDVETRFRSTRRRAPTGFCDAFEVQCYLYLARAIP